MVKETVLLEVVQPSAFLVLYDRLLDVSPELKPERPDMAPRLANVAHSQSRFLNFLSVENVQFSHQYLRRLSVDDKSRRALDLIDSSANYTRQLLQKSPLLQSNS